tara:strand:+ start:2725 stop:3057 length:333 start_codon:yes stop_codon:yes gene_type:complete
MKTYQDVVKQCFKENENSKMTPQEKMVLAGKKWKEIKAGKPYHSTKKGKGSKYQSKGKGIDEEEKGEGFGKDVAWGFNKTMKYVGKPLNTLATIATLGTMPNIAKYIPEL